MTKIVSLNKLFAIRYSLFAGKTVVLTTGVFDLLHSEHKKLLQAARKEGNLLLVGLESNQRTRQIKGATRPVNTIEQRLKNLAQLNIANYVFELPPNLGIKKGREDLIKKLQPHIYAVSQSTPHLGEKRRVMKLTGGTVKVVLPHNPSFSTSKILRHKTV